MESFRETLVNASRGTNFQFPSITLSSYESLAPTTTDQLPLLSIDPREGRDVLILRINLQEEAHVIHVISTSAQHNCSHFAFLPATKISKIDPSSSSSSLSPYKISKITIPSFARIFETSGRPRAHTKEETLPPFFSRSWNFGGIFEEKRGEGKKERRKKIRNRIEKR